MIEKSEELSVDRDKEIKELKDQVAGADSELLFAGKLPETLMNHPEMEKFMRDLNLLSSSFVIGSKKLAEKLGFELTAKTIFDLNIIKENDNG